ncbi:GDSL esterase/lipase EXL3-like [Quercus robur]|uniref:GDSL esterase/lipase EXL3-like n=1 Tax=Quercus robur TaxID=38942 RepID=UPI00216265F6|nr:GDSL esterase/lipase EXL3-like [Quercus robur]
MHFLFKKMFSSSAIVLFSLTAFVLFCNTNAVIKPPGNATIPAFIAFGDSIMDTGNNYIETIAKCNFPPYGRDFVGGKPTGRWSNGKAPTDLIAEELGIKELVPPYLDPNLQLQDLKTGVCFASGGTGYDPLTPILAFFFFFFQKSVISLPDQLRMFKEYIGKLNATFGAEQTNFILANSLFFLVAGSNDIANTYYLSPSREIMYDISSYTDLMIKFASKFLKELQGLGARRIGVFSAPPLGCIPSQRTTVGGLQRNCAEKYNRASLLFNSKLNTTIDSLNKNLPDSRIVYVDVYNPFLDIIENPQNYGFHVADRGCCGTGDIEVAVLCTSTPTTCVNASDYIFWDSYHPTEAVYRTLISQFLPKYINSFF